MDTTPWYALSETQGFYWTPTNTKGHSGIDLGTDVGRPITAPFDGTQVSEGTEPWGGQENELVKDASGNYHVLTWLHMSAETPIPPGAPVHAGDLLGYSGTPPAGFGNGPHIHFENTAGRTAPYMGYNPWFPSRTSYPISPQPVLNQLKSGGEGGTLGGNSGGISPAVSFAGINVDQAFSGVSDPLGIVAGLHGLSSVVSADVAAAQNTAADALKRMGVFVIGLVLAIVGLLVIFAPVLEQAFKDTAQGVQHVATEAAGAAAVAA